MKLTDEQREVIDSIMSDANSGDWKKIESAQFTMNLSSSQLIPAIYASEQAWKEEAERLEQERSDFATTYFRIREEQVIEHGLLNQAIEVLKDAKSEIAVMSDTPYELPIYQRITGFLSSLQEDKT